MLVFAHEGTVRAGEYLAYRTYLDSHIKPGVRYRIRPTGHDDYLFHGKPVRLLKVRPAEYCYRMKFEVLDEECTDPKDEKSCCIFTDSWQPEGVAFTPVPPAAWASPTGIRTLGCGSDVVRLVSWRSRL